MVNIGNKNMFLQIVLLKNDKNKTKINKVKQYLCNFISEKSQKTVGVYEISRQ